MGDYSRELAPVIKWVVIAVLLVALWKNAPEIYVWLKTEFKDWVTIIK